MIWKERSMNEHMPVSLVTDLPDFQGAGAFPARHAGPIDWSDFSRQAEQPSLLIFADPEGRPSEREDVTAMAASLGLRLLDHVPISAASERLSHVVDVDGILVRCKGTEAGIDMLLARLDTMVSGQGIGLVVIVDFEGLDHVHAIVGAADAVILCDPAPQDVALALALTCGRFRDRERLHDIGREQADPRIDKMSDELIRLSRTIEALVQNRIPSQFVPSHADGNGFAFHSPERSFSAFPGGKEGRDAPGVDPGQVRAVLRSRRLRDHIFSSDLFADPAWDILLDLMAARLEGTKVSVSSLCIAAAVPPTTALRWIRQLTERGLLERHSDPHDGRRIFIALSEKGAEGVTRWFEENRGHMLHALGQGNEGKSRSKSQG